ncbi:E3 ubiquitin-protein ligase Rnf220 isoform X2 [Patella vulgata]|nr:E3 ubiquitin-protein ligase Rnf220 isoform X2 [Patella vulgata]
MENSSFVPNLMVLAPTGDGHEAPRLPHPYSGQNMDKDLSSPFGTAPFTMYRPGDPFAPPLYAPMPPFVRPTFERGINLISSQGGGAFRPLGQSSEGISDYQSAFTPAKKTKLDDAGTSSFNRIDSPDSRTNSPEIKTSASCTVKDERPSSISSAGYDTNSENLSENGDMYDRGTPDSEGRSLRKQRKKSVLDGQAPCCPICGLTLRHSDVESHFNLEIEKLEKLSRGGRKSRDTTPQGRKSLPSPSGCRKGKDSPSPEVISQARFETYLRIRCNRQARLSSRCRNRKKKPGEDGVVKESSCPICNEKLTGTSDELNSHVELCLKRRGDLEDEPVDVEGDGEQYEEYTWAGQTRIRATSLLEGGFAGSGFLTSSCRKLSDEDCDLNVDVDDSEQYGTPQYSEVDIVPLRADEPSENQERLALRGALLGNCSKDMDQTPVYNSTAVCKSNHQISTSNHNNDIDSNFSSSHELIEALKAKLKDKEEQKNKQKCLICMDAYKEPLASIQCWHVHCESCWLQTLGAKKLCPQCNTITSSSDLRRIFL